tara:strand:- start:11308 stop:11580 length:273 start_codon:yes stop_codon:yes gene_type:complete
MKLFNFIRNTGKPKPRYLYAIKNGDYAGHFCAFIYTTPEKHIFLTVPNNQKIEVPLKDFEDGLKEGIVDFVEVLPRHVYKVIKAQYDATN